MVAYIVVLAVVVGCGSPASDRPVERSVDGATRFFTDGRRIGSSPDAGLYKASIAGGWDHVATVHGVVDDVGLCQIIASSLNAKGDQGRFECRVLNR
jgi:hypothetical protein